MRISQLSEATGVPVATIKYYIRKCLLPRGRSTAPNQARYDETHVARLRLIRSLREVADLPITTIARVVAVLDDPADVAESRHVVTALQALDPQPAKTTPEARAVVDRLLSRLRWEIHPEAPGYRALAGAIAALDEHWPGAYSMEGLERYAAIAAELAEQEIPADWDPSENGSESVAYAVLGTILFEPVILALRRIAHAERHRRLTSATNRPPNS